MNEYPVTADPCRYIDPILDLVLTWCCPCPCNLALITVVTLALIMSLPFLHHSCHPCLHTSIQVLLEARVLAVYLVRIPAEKC